LLLFLFLVKNKYFENYTHFILFS